MAKQLRSKLGDDTDHPAYTFTELRVGYRMESGDGGGEGRVTEIEEETGPTCRLLRSFPLPRHTIQAEGIYRPRRPQLCIRAGPA